MKSKKAAISTGKSKTNEEVSTKTTENTVTPEERHHMIAEAAYFRAEHRIFQGANLEQDWLESEVEIDNLLVS
jgi:Protein of unknown function (DUF2934)